MSEGCGSEFFSGGLKFTCRQCSHCCRDFPGVVLLSEADLERFAKWAELTREQFIQVYCRWVPDDSGKEYLSLKETRSYDCIFWENGGCTAYEARPVQCRTFPFWTGVLKDEDSWLKQGRECPGINCGELHSREEILGELKKYEGRNAIFR